MNKRIIAIARLIIILMAGTFFSSCGEDEEIIDTETTPDIEKPDPEEPIEPTKTKTLLFKAKIGPSTRMSYEETEKGVNYQWENEDRITVCYKHTYEEGIYNEWKDLSIKSINGSDAEFAGEFTEGELVNFPDHEWKYIWALSPAAPRIEESHWSTAILCSADKQEIKDGRLQLSAAYSTARATYTEGQATKLMFEPRMAFTTFQVDLRGKNISTIKELRIIGAGIYKKRILNLEAPDEPYFEWKNTIGGVPEIGINIKCTGPLPIKNGQMTFSAFLFPSEEVGSVKIYIIDDKNNEYICPVRLPKNLESGKSYVAKTKIMPAIIGEMTDHHRGALFDKTGHFVAHYSLDETLEQIRITYLEDGILRHNKAKLEITSETELSFTPIKGLDFSGFNMEDKKITIKSNTLAFRSQSTAYDEIMKAANMRWGEATLLANGLQSQTYGDGKNSIKEEFKANGCVEYFLIQNASSHNKRLTSWGITKHGDIHCEFTKVNEDEIKFGETTFGYGGNGNYFVSSGILTHEEMTLHEAPLIYIERTMPDFYDLFYCKQNLIIVKECISGKTYFYMLSTGDSDNWVKFEVI